MFKVNKNRNEIEKLIRNINLSEVSPFIMVIQGPSRVGKSTLIRELIEYYSKNNFQDVAGPITFIAGKTRRLTIIECSQDIDSMIDCAKIADLVICLIDGSFGFEIDTFEFFALLQAHGFSRVIGLLTHMDKFNVQKELKNIKKNLKQRFWSEIYKGAKVKCINKSYTRVYKKYNVSDEIEHIRARVFTFCGLSNLMRVDLKIIILIILIKAILFFDN